MCSFCKRCFAYMNMHVFTNKLCCDFYYDSIHVPSMTCVSVSFTKLHEHIYIYIIGIVITDLNFNERYKSKQKQWR